MSSFGVGRGRHNQLACGEVLEQDQTDLELLCPGKEALKVFTGTLLVCRVLRVGGLFRGCTAPETFFTLSHIFFLRLHAVPHVALGQVCSGWEQSCKFTDSSSPESPSSLKCS